MTRRTGSVSRGFTLLELVVVVAIVMVLIALLLPVVNKARYEAKVVACLSNLRQIGVGLTNYAMENEGWYPAKTHGELPLPIPSLNACPEAASPSMNLSDHVE